MAQNRRPLRPPHRCLLEFSEYGRSCQLRPDLCWDTNAIVLLRSHRNDGVEGRNHSVHFTRVGWLPSLASGPCEPLVTPLFPLAPRQPEPTNQAGQLYLMHLLFSSRRPAKFASKLDSESHLRLESFEVRQIKRAGCGGCATPNLNVQRH